MVSVERGADDGAARVISSAKLTSDDFDAVARELGVSPMKARKTGLVAARLAKETVRVDTIWNGKESTNVANPGDLIVTNVAADRRIIRDGNGNVNTYVIRAHRFIELYERDAGTTEYGDLYRARGTVDAVYIPGGFDICAPWGERQFAEAGYILRSGREIYGNAKETFEMTYAELR